jgi:uncharacterized protein (DUF924 family)
MLLNDKEIESILTFWFPNEKFNKFWFDKSIDNKIYEEYYNLLIETYKKFITITNFEDLEYEEILAIIILFDQFSRNINRLINLNIYEFTINAKKLSMICINKNYLFNKKMNHISFILMPLRHLNKVSDYKLILEILDKIEDNTNEIFNKFKSETIKKLDLLKN